MKALTPEMAAHLGEDTTALATCWRIERRDGTAFYFTDHDQDIDFYGFTYRARSGYSRTAIETKAGLKIDDVDVEGLLDSDEITEQDLRLGLFDGAKFWIFMVNWRDPVIKEVPLRHGYLGEVFLSGNGQFTVELRGLMQIAQQSVVQFYSPMCRADFGDTRCGVDLDAIGVAGTVGTVVSGSRFTINLAEATPDPSRGGLLTWTSGQNSGRREEVVGWNETGLELFMGALYPVETGDAFTLVPGCDKRFQTCRDTFDNAVNFRGEPFLPGSDMLRKFPEATT